MITATRAPTVAVWSFHKPSPSSKIASTRIARFLSEELAAPLCWDAEINRNYRLDVLFIVNGAYAFCKHLPALAEAVRRARRVVWVQNDYTIVPPKHTSSAESPFRAAFRQRAELGLPHYDLWTTIDPTPAYAVGDFNAYINWNQLTYNHVNSMLAVSPREDRSKSLLYYGAYRINREESFNRYFNASLVKTVIATSNEDTFRNAYVKSFNQTKVISSLPEESMASALASYGAGLYIEDKRSHKEFHSPANRFYEMLSAGLPMLFDYETYPMLKLAGFDVSQYVVRNERDVKRLFAKRKEIARAQSLAWKADYRKRLRRQLQRCWTEYKTAYF